MNEFHPMLALLGGALIGLSASAVLLFQGKIAGISGIVGGVLQGESADRSYRLSFLFGLLAAGVVLLVARPQSFAENGGSPIIAGVAGLLVGYGTRLGNGCTSGHGVCGISRFSVRSIVATVTFIGTGAVTVLIARHFMGGTP